MPETYEVAIIDLNLVISEKATLHPSSFQAACQDSGAYGTVEYIYIIASILEFSIKFFLKIPHNSDFFPPLENEVIVRYSFNQRKNDAGSKGRC